MTGRGAAPVVDFYERPGCHLCTDALAIVERVAAESGALVRRHDIDADAALQRAYGELIPVVVVDGEPHAQWFVDEARLREALG
ncbi:MAG: glutaredoxin family protein [Microbacteriaceae bacterium]|nr:glutaredoxin family protein [Microbacteriaceae bacterium]